MYTEPFLSLNVPLKKRYVFEFVKTTVLLMKIWNVQINILGTFCAFDNSELKGGYLHIVNNKNNNTRQHTFSFQLM